MLNECDLQSKTRMLNIVTAHSSVVFFFWWWWWEGGASHLYCISDLFCFVYFFNFVKVKIAVERSPVMEENTKLTRQTIAISNERFKKWKKKKQH